jgi:hypothetical protein
MSYARNLRKEGGDLVNAWREAFDASAGVGPGASEKAARANKKQRAEQGQFLGALLQGRKYDKKGKQVKK